MFFFLLFNGLIVATCVSVYKRNKHVGIFISTLYVLCSLGLLFYINFADGTRMEQRDRDYWVSAMTRNVADLNSAGAGISSLPDPNELIDLRQTIDHSKLAIERLRMRNASEGKIAEFEKKNRTLAMHLFGDGKLTEEDEEMLEYLFSCGTYGTMSNHVSNMLQKKKWGKTRYVLSRLFAPIRKSNPYYDIYAKKYPLFYKYKVLLLFLPFYRVIRGLRRGKLQKEVNTLKNVKQ